MARIDFKSVGVRQSDTATTDALNNTQTVTYFGIKTPLRPSDNSEGLFAMNTSLSDQIKDNFINLLYTNHGERLANYDFGANLKPLVAERHSKEDFDEEAAVRIKTSVTKYMSFVSLSTFESFFDPSLRGGLPELSTVRVRVSYDVVVPGIISDRNKLVEVVFQTM
jgi:phage baseplate assembly protein W